MRKIYATLFTLTLLLIVALPLQPTQALAPAPAPQNTTPYEVVDAVNALRTQYGLSPYTSNAILMQIAQTHADYMMSSGNMGHINGQGLKPFQRALQAGYAVAGDIYTSVGWFSENIVAGFDMTAEQAVEEWAVMDELHLRTMISANLVDIGAGVAVDGNYYIYVIDCGRSTGGTAVPLESITTDNTTTTSVERVPPVQNADGSVTYTVQANDTLLGISSTYGVNLNTIYALNGLNENSVIYIGDVIVLSSATTITPTQLNSTATEFPTITPWPTSTLTETSTSIPLAPSGGLPASSAGVAVGVIIATALMMALIITLLGKKQSG